MAKMKRKQLNETFKEYAMENINRKSVEYRKDQEQRRLKRIKIAGEVYKILIISLIYPQIKMYFDFHQQSLILWDFLVRKVNVISRWYRRAKQIKMIKQFYKKKKLLFGYVYIYYFLRTLRNKREAVEKIIPCLVFSKLKNQIRMLCVDYKNHAMTLYEFFLWNQKKNQYYRYCLSVQWDMHI